MSIENPVIKIIKVCNAHDVESICRQGFTLREIIYTEQIEHGSENHQQSRDQYGCVTTLCDTKPFLARIPLFVMEQHGDQAMQDLQNQLSGLQSELTTAKKAGQEATKELATTKSRLDELKKIYEDLVKSYRSNQDNNTEVRAASRKLEEDLGKVRAAIGELRMKEIIGRSEEKT